MNRDYNNGQSDQQSKGNDQGQYGYGQQSYGNPYGNPYGTQGNPYGSPYGNPYDGYRPPIHFQVGPDDNARSCHTMGLLAVVFLFVSQILSIVFGVIALNYAKKSVRALGYECPEMKSGRTMGKVGLIGGIILTGLTILFYVFVVVAALTGPI